MALVTASSQGLGKACAVALASEGANLVMCSRDQKSIEHSAEEIRDSTRAKVLPLTADVSQARDIERLVAAARKEFGTVHILVNNAGGPPTGDILTLPDEEWARGVNLTLMSVVRLVRSVLPMMVGQKWGRIVTITSYVAKQPADELLLSATLRPGIHGLTKIISNRHARDNVTANTVCPGNILTKRQEELAQARAAQAAMTPDAYLAESVRQIPAGRMGRPEEVGNVVAFLASEQASYVTGVNLLIDGGLTKGLN